jgi:GT2 family glycosyltransferase
MDDLQVVASTPSDRLIRIEGGPQLPLARARNIGAQAAIDAGAELLIFLDVDCLPSPQLIERYRAAAEQSPGELLCGPVDYLDPPGPRGYDLEQLPDPPRGHPARPVPADGQLATGGDHALFWSLSFALTARQWSRIGGFDESYAGYGGEDTDFGQRARAAGIALTWVGGAWAFHQYHPTNDPPIQHLEDILRNAEVFYRRWNWWPMQGWLDAFEQLGLIGWDEDDQRWHRVAAEPAGV